MSKLKEVLTFQIQCTGAFDVKGTTGEAVMIQFTGSANCEYFKGTVLPGGIDTQKERKGENRTLSARYILEGTDYKGNACRIFVENNGVAKDGQIKNTMPIIYTDSQALSFLETAKLEGTISPLEGGVEIHIFCEEVS